MVLLAAAALAVPWVAVPAQAAPRALLGADISYPQCGRSFPARPAFSIIGVNGGRPGTTNPCLSAELAWGARSSGGTPQDKVQLYVNTANPGPSDPRWPRSGSNRYGTCDRSASRACAYQYGWERAHDDATVRGIAGPQNYMWWLDVEVSNSWRGTGSENAAVLEGMTEYFTSIHSRGVGIYSTSRMWAQVVGHGVGPRSSLNGRPNWSAVIGGLTEARTACGLRPLTPGSRIEMIQFTTNFDYDFPCI
jgi:hypothetical protein